MQYTYKHLSPADVGILKELLKVFSEAFNEVATYQGAVPSDDYLRALLSKPHFMALVALAHAPDGPDAPAPPDQKVVGGLVAYELEKFEQDRREIYIYDLAVAEPHRRRGIATGLINELRRLAKHRKAYVIFVQADYGDDPAIRLYESLGKRESVLHFDIPVEG